VAQFKRGEVLRNTAADKTGNVNIRVSGKVPSLMLNKMADGVGKKGV
jgi:hypothetical protein